MRFVPGRKISVAALAGAVVVVADWALRTFAHVEQPPTVVASEVVIVGSVAGYLIPEAEQA